MLDVSDRHAAAGRESVHRRTLAEFSLPAAYMKAHPNVVSVGPMRDGGHSGNGRGGFVEYTETAASAPGKGPRLGEKGSRRRRALGCGFESVALDSAGYIGAGPNECIRAFRPARYCEPDPLELTFPFPGSPPF